MKNLGSLIFGLMMMSLLPGCGENPAEAQYKHQPRDFMRQVVACESHYSAIGHTARCRQALRMNARLFGPQ